MTREEKRRAKQNAAHEIGQHKHHLIDTLRKLEEIGAPEANQLASILGRLESLQIKLNK